MRVQPTNVGEQSEFSPRENWRGAAKKSHAPASDSAVTASPEAFFGGAAGPTRRSFSSEQPGFCAVMTSSSEEAQPRTGQQSKRVKMRVARRCDSTVGWLFVDFQAVGASSTGGLKTRKLKAFGGVQPEKAVTMPDYNSKTWRVVVRC